MTQNSFGILLVEDEPDAAESMNELLLGIDTRKFRGKETAKPTVSIARDQTELESKAQAAFDLVILDMRYPGKDGQINDREFEGIKYLPKLRGFQPRAAIAIQTAFAYGNDMQSAVTALADQQADEYFPKGLNWKATEARLAAAWDRRRERRNRQYLHRSYLESHHSRIYRALAEDTRDEVYRRSSRFRNLASQLENSGNAAGARSVRDEYDNLISEVDRITVPVEELEEQGPQQIAAATVLDELQLFDWSPGVAVTLDHAEGSVHTYSRDLQSALYELIENAVEAIEGEMKQGRRSGGDVRLSARSVSDRRRGLEITIADDGPGFPQDVLDDPFRRGRSSKETRGKPRGMGLYVAQRFMNRIFGSVILSNRTPPEHGAEAILFVPDLGKSAS